MHVAELGLNIFLISLIVKNQSLKDKIGKSIFTIYLQKYIGFEINVLKCEELEMMIPEFISS